MLEAAAICRAEGGQLPLPKNDQESEDFRSGGYLGGMIDSFDLDGDGIWHDSYGNEVTYFAPFHYSSFENLAGGPWQYKYMSASRSENIWYVSHNSGNPVVNCMIPLASAPEPPAPVQGKTKSFFIIPWYFLTLIKSVTGETNGINIDGAPVRLASNTSDTTTMMRQLPFVGIRVPAYHFLKMTKNLNPWEQDLQV